MDYKFFEDGNRTIDVVIRNFEVIGKAAKNIPKEIQVKYKSVPWKDLARLLDKLIHQYFKIKLQLV